DRGLRRPHAGRVPRAHHRPPGRRPPGTGGHRLGAGGPGGRPAAADPPRGPRDPARGATHHRTAPRGGDEVIRRVSRDEAGARLRPRSSENACSPPDGGPRLPAATSWGVLHTTEP